MTPKRARQCAKRRAMTGPGRRLNESDGYIRLMTARIQRKFVAEGRTFRWQDVTPDDFQSVRRVNGGRQWDKFPPKKHRKTEEK